MAKVIKINESMLKDIVCETISDYLNDNELDEGFLGNMWSGVKNAAQSTGQAIAQHGNKLMADYNAGVAQNLQQEIKNQIQKSQEIINREQAKINNLRAKYNSQINKTNSYVQKANQNAAKRMSNTRYTNYDLQQDKQKQDFYNQNDLSNQVNTAYARGVKRGYSNNNSPRPTRRRKQPQQQEVA